ncbi:MAG: class I SAM-dependent methyltransferase [Acutalibacteraceae bacterium]
MLNSNGFDLWANNYDIAVGLSDDDGTYPFAGYKDVLNTIYNSVMSASGNVILDIGFGTGTLSAKLYEQGYMIYGQDFSEKMIEIAQQKMPNAKLYQGDFTNGLTDELKHNKYDAIIATYSIHHLTDAQKIAFIESLLPLLNEGGCIYFGDVAFQTRSQLEMCKTQAGDEWDDDEIYFVFDEINKSFPDMKFERISHCAGVLTIRK